jgi:DNA polymerase III subunit epsilon
MSIHQIILDTETTGIRVEDGHKIIEIGCLEMIDRKLTGRYFHQYINPEREVDAGAFAVHGISNEFLKDKPPFRSICNEFMNFISNAELIIHNAPFDLSFLNHELFQTKQGWRSITDYCQVVDTLKLARQLHAGQKNTLDALCKRYKVDNSKRDLHGALLDAHLLAQVYLIMTGGQGSFFDAPMFHPVMGDNKAGSEKLVLADENLTMTLLKANDDELKEHDNYLTKMKEQGKCLWLDEE